MTLTEKLSKDLLCICGKPTVVRTEIDMRSCGKGLCKVEIVTPKFADLARRLAQGLAHLGWCQSCCEGSWTDTPECQAADQALTEARKAGLLEDR